MSEFITPNEELEEQISRERLEERLAEKGADLTDDLQTAARTAGGIGHQCPLHDHGYDFDRLGHVTAQLTTELPEPSDLDADAIGAPENDMSAHDQGALGISNPSTELKLS